MTESTFLILVKDEIPLKLHDFAKSFGPRCIIHNNIYPVSGKWVPNLVSTLTSSYPSHHRIWNATSKLGFHIDNIVTRLNSSNTACKIIGDADSIKIVEKLGINKCKSEENDSAILDTFETELAQNNRDQPSVQLYLMNNWNEKIYSIIKSTLDGSVENQSKHVLITSIILDKSIETIGQSHLFFFSDHNLGKRSPKLKNEKISLIDIPTTILQHYGQMRPNNMIGKEIKWFFLDKSRKHKARTRKHILVEFENGGKSLFTDKYLLNIHMGSKKGEIYDLIGDPKRKNNLWDDPKGIKIKQVLFLQFISEQMHKEITPMPRIAGA